VNHESPILSAAYMILLPSVTGPAEASIVFLSTLDTGFAQEIHDDFILLCPFLSLCPYSIDFMGIFACAQTPCTKLTSNMNMQHEHAT
jgi:hypothetical protein